MPGRADLAAKAKADKEKETYGPTSGDHSYDVPVPKGYKPPKPKKVVKKKKAPPIPVPSLEAGWAIDNPPPKTAARKPEPTKADSVVFKKPAPKKGANHGGHKPIKYLYVPIEDLLLPPPKGSERDRAIQRFNQNKEKNRRDFHAYEEIQRKQRRAEVAKIPKATRDMIGRSALRDYIAHGPQPDNPGLLGAVAHALPHLALDAGVGSAKYINRAINDWRTQLSGGLSGRRAGMRGEVAKGDNDLVNAAGEMLVGGDLLKAISGQEYDGRMALMEAVLLGIPIKGLPTSMSAGLRVSLGASRFARMVRSGATVADAVKAAEWTKPVLTARAERRAALRLADAPRSSSKAAGIVADIVGDNKAGRFIRNDPSTQRVFRKGDLTVKTPADLSRTGKVVRGALDRGRGGRLGKVPGITSEAKMVDKVLAQQAETIMNKYAGVAAAIKLPRNRMGQIDWPGVYAVRTVLKNHNIGEVINRTAADLAAAEKAGDDLGARALLHHLNYFKAAARYLDKGKDGASVLRQDAPADLEELRAALVGATDAREQILKDVDLLTEARASDRVLNEEKFYQGATHQVRNDFIQQALEANPVRQQAERILAEHHPASKKKALAILDGMARTWYENVQRESREKLEDIRHLMFSDTSDEVTMNARYMAARRLQQDIENQSPADFYEHFAGVQDELPPDVIAELTEEYGAQGQDWFFRLHDLMAGAGDEDIKRIADDIIASGLSLPPELDTPEKLAAGIAKVFKLAHDGEFGKDWYTTAAEGVKLVSEHVKPGGHLPHGVTPKQVAQLFAIFSQAADTVANSTFVFDAIRQFQAHGDLFAGRFPVRQSEEALKVLQGGGYEGRKRNSFYANMLRHIPGMEEEYAATIKEMAEERGAEVLHPVTVDRWVVRMFSDELGDVPGKYYDTFETIMQKMAASLGWEPEQIQAAAWVAKKDEGLKAEHAAQIAAGKKPRVTVRHIAGAGDDFSYGIQRQIEKEEAGLFDTEKYAVTPEQKRVKNRAGKLVKAVNKEWGGFTVNRDLTPVDEVGYSVTLSLTETEFPLHGVTQADLEHFRDKYADLLKDSRIKIGGFSDDANDVGDGTDVTYLSLSRQFKRKADAMKFAREQGQETVYEYPKVDPVTGKKPKIGDGIRTGLSREEQASIIQGLRDAEPIPATLHAPLPKTTPEREYDKFLEKAAVEMQITKAGKKPTASQLARTEEWLLKNADRYQDEPTVKEWERLYDAKRPAEEEPDWMRFRIAARSQGTPNANPVGLMDDALGIKGEALAKKVKGYATAVKALDRADIPTAFIKRVWNDPNLHLYDKVKIGLHLNRLSGGGLRGRAFPDIPGVEKMFDSQQLGGMYMGDRRLVIQSPNGRGIDMLHEFFHGAEGQSLLPEGLLDDMNEFVGAARGARGRDLTDHQAEDLADMWEAMFLGFDPKASKLPNKMKKAMEKMSKAMRDGQQGPTKRAQAMLDRMPDELRVSIEDALWYDAKAGKRSGMYGAGPDFKHRPGGTYVPEQPGLPFSYTERLMGPRRYGTLYNRLKEGRRVQTLTPTDQALEHAFTGRLLASGRWARDVTSGPLHGLIKAMEIEKMAFLRDNILEATTDIPRHITDVAVPVDPKAFAESKNGGQELGDLFAVFDVMDAGLPVHAQQLDAVTVSGIEQAKDFFFPGYSEVTKADIEKLAATTVKPIEGIRWIDRATLDRTGILSPPGVNARIKSTWGKRAMSSYDTTNNIMKLLTLSLNPSYYTMNLAGQGVMLLMQQGAFAPVSLARSLANLADLSEETRALLLAHAGAGQASVVHAEGGFGRGLVNKTQAFANAVIDRHPRMAAIAYEARRLGYKTAAELDDLVTNPSNFEDLFTASRRAKRSLVDFDNLSYAEKEYLGRLVFVYPWLRASGKWAAQFPFDHPIQAAGFAALMYWQQQRIKEAFPEGHPGYLKWYFPIDTAKSGGDPYGFRLDQMFTPLQPLDLASELAWLMSGTTLPWGSNGDAAVGRLNPLLEEIVTFLSGHDAFRNEDVQRNLLASLRRLVDPEQRYASWNRIMKVVNHEEHKGLYDTNQTQNWLRVILGSLAPTDINKDVAGDMVAPTRTVTVPDVAPEEKQRRFMEQVTEAAAAEGETVPPELAGQYEAWETYNKMESEFKNDHDIDSLKPQERLAVLLLTWGKLRGREEDAKARANTALGMTDADAEDAIEEGREALGLSRIDRIKRRLSEQSTESRDPVEATP